MSRHFGPWIARARRELKRSTARADFEADVAAGRDTIDVLAHPLLPYQRLGAMHLAFGERALLADDMGLGKTIQAIAACELLARRKGVARVLVVCPASLKARVGRTDRAVQPTLDRLVFGPRAQRVSRLREPAFFTIVNYEQVISDADDINALLRPDVVVLDEAQRIKNWQTKTARASRNRSAPPYAFVLTGTPVENRIDELYSIVQYLDPEILGPLFRFNRDFYELDERGRPVDYRNLVDLRERVGLVMLRRRKAEVEKELPGRTVKNYFVPMAEEQKLRYEDYRTPAAQLDRAGAKTPFAGAGIRAPSDAARMHAHDLRHARYSRSLMPRQPQVRGAGGHSRGSAGGGGPQGHRLLRMGADAYDGARTRRRNGLRGGVAYRIVAARSPACGDQSVQAGSQLPVVSFDRQRQRRINLQVASAVVNVDLPWNPAKLEQRIARAWRKNQTRSVSVINLVTEGSIEHSILHLLGQKQALADGVLDGDGDLSALKMPSGRGAFIERMQAMMVEPQRSVPRILSPEEDFVADLVDRLGENALLVEAHEHANGRLSLLAVLDLDRNALAAEIERGSTGIEVEFVDRAGWLMMRRLAASGMLRFTHEARLLHRSPALLPESTEPKADDGRGAAAMADADRSLKMAKVLLSGGFAEEVLPLLVKSLRGMALALSANRGEAAAASGGDGDIRRLVEQAALPAEALTILDAANPAVMPATASGVEPLIAATGRILATIRRNEPRLHVGAA